MIGRTLALAGIFQCTYLVEQLARHGRAGDDGIIDASLNSVYAIDPESPLAVYGDTDALCVGLETLVRQLDGDRSSRSPDVTRYAATLMHLERQFMSNDEMCQSVQTSLHILGARRQGTEPHTAQQIEDLASVYRETISTLRPQIMVSGEPTHLNNVTTAQTIRALLLAGLRSSVLWRQTGGNRLDLLLGRKRYVNHARQLLTT